ncbi:GGDEF domain-containing protein [Teredinibacter turnerae]|uniref:GGDEF domain-containing protein n=1 Tax=Teredinibacter turnerae TaxID=2426 RepID=UPI0003715264|nr:GGDEF domain-containing protein [Teredinibacter turnerae]
MNDSTADTPASLHCPRGNDCPISAELSQLRDRVTELEQHAQTDPLTGLYNKRYFDAVLHRELERTQRTGMPTTLIMLDVDHFKLFNDTHGHVAGDHALKHLARTLRSNLRNLDIACRFGGEEFVVVLPSTPLLVAIQVAERLRQQLTNSTLVIDASAMKLTASFGVDTYTHEHRDNLLDFVERVDKQLYLAKSAGRNCVKHATSAPRSAHEVTPEERDALF